MQECVELGMEMGVFRDAASYMSRPRVYLNIGRFFVVFCWFLSLLLLLLLLFARDGSRRHAVSPRWCTFSFSCAQCDAADVDRRTRRGECRREFYI